MVDFWSDWVWRTFLWKSVRDKRRMRLTLRRYLSTMGLPHPEHVKGNAVCEVVVRVAVWTSVPLPVQPPLLALLLRPGPALPLAVPLVAPMEPLRSGERSSIATDMVSIRLSQPVSALEVASPKQNRRKKEPLVII